MISIIATSRKFADLAGRTYSDLSDLILDVTETGSSTAVLAIDDSQGYDIDCDGVDGEQLWLGSSVWDAHRCRETSGLYSIADALEQSAGFAANMLRTKGTRRIWAIARKDMTQDASISCRHYVDFEISA